MKHSRKYIYAIISGRQNLPGGLCGIDGAPVHSVCAGGVAAAVSDVFEEKIRPDRSHLAVHQAVLRELLELATPLPVSFGMVAGSVQAVRGMLRHSEEAFLLGLQRVQGKVEMGLRVTWSVSDVFEFFINTHDELRRARDQLFGMRRQPSREEKIDIGRLFDRILQDDRDAHRSEVETVLEGCCSEIRDLPCRREQEVMNLACLIEKDRISDFEAAVLETARLFDNNFAFDYNGPWAPHNFVDSEGLNLGSEGGGEEYVIGR